VSDTLKLELGETLDFEGQKARHVGTLPAAIMEGKSGSGGMAEPYKVFNPKKSGAFSYFKGKPVYELVDPEGNVYVMQAGSQVVDPSLTLESLAAPGWKYRVRTLDKDLVFDLPKGTVVDAVSDDLRISITVFRGPRNETGISPKCRPE